jgi:hypothetical protein
MLGSIKVPTTSRCSKVQHWVVCGVALICSSQVWTILPFMICHLAHHHVSHDITRAGFTSLPQMQQVCLWSLPPTNGYNTLLSLIIQAIVDFDILSHWTMVDHLVISLLSKLPEQCHGLESEGSVNWISLCWNEVGCIKSWVIK